MTTQVEVYVPAYVPPGTITLAPRVMFAGPSPEPAEALKTATAGGNELPAGIETGYGAMVFVGRSQFPAPALTDVTPVIEAAVAGNASAAAFVKRVEVNEMFQPAPDPVSSSAVRTIGAALV